MEIRWKRGLLVLLVIAVIAIPANDASSEERHQQGLENSSKVSDTSRSDASAVESGTHSADFGYESMKIK
ncbi:lipoprotein LA7 [Anopheles sinensis]|uniref:Lipoprotein LA7 n=1 Tax=Anopheles sinensis TaxID=74873 RepID=A0A084VZ34_ANOSI|nr:lipoprotein LA7 [Anopheles sinensis]